jgi:tetratricopeptide (TPR) repeat protein
MSEIDSNKTVFISYRRDVSSFIARAIFMDLRANGYDVFMDVESIDSGAFDTVILNQIAARAHFVLILTPGSVERCVEKDDWLRREIETAIKLKRNIVPLLVNNFSFKGNEVYLKGNLEGLSRYNSLNVPHDFFDAAMERLRTRFLKQPVVGDITPTPANQQQIIEHKIEEVISQPPPSSNELMAETFFVQGDIKRRTDDYDGAITAYSEAIHLNPKYAAAYYHRGLAQAKKQNFEAAVADYSQALNFDPEYRSVYSSRAFARLEIDDVEGAIQDRDQAMLLDQKQTAKSYMVHGDYHNQVSELDKALGYYDKALSANPNFIQAYLVRGSVRYQQNDFAGAIADYSKAIELDSDSIGSYNNRGEAYFAIGQYKSALSDFKKVNAFKAGDNFALAGLAITYHATKNFEEAHRLWKLLTGSDLRFRDPNWVQKELNWAEPLVDEARKLIATLDQPK